MKFKELAENRYSCRKFLKQSVEEDKIEALLDVISYGSQCRKSSADSGVGD